MAQQKLKEIRNYRANPRSAHEEPDPNHREDILFTQSDYDASPTKQSDAEAADINFIMKRYEQTGLLPDAEGRRPIVGDFSTMETYHEAMQVVAEANSSFFALPAEIRAKFQNDPGQFLAYVEKAPTDKEIATDLVKMGLAVQREQEKESTDDILRGIRDGIHRADLTKQQKPSGASKEE